MFLRLLAFAVVALGVLAGWHAYLWARLVRDPGWPPLARRILTGFLVALALAPILLGAARRLLGEGPGSPVAAAGNLWLGVGFVLLVTLVSADVARLLGGWWRHLSGAAGDLPTGPADPARREVLARAVALGATGVAAASGLVGARAVLGEIATPEVVVRLSRLPKALDGLKIVQLTDVHIGSSLGGPFLRSVVERTNALKPDLVVLTGDLVDGPVRHLSAETASFGRLAARWGVYAVTGNHEFYSGPRDWIAELARLGIPTLGNRRVSIGDPGGASLDLAGVHDYTGRDDLAMDLPRALAGRDPARELVLLAHQPRAVAAAQAAGVGLVLAGHTHGGQIQPFGALVRLAQPYIAGLHRRGDTQIYVSRGTGVWGPPMRIGAPAEITQIFLTAAA